ncbi:MAG: polyphosphate kinase 1 [Tannerella sp.]|jgi:polyphosphate kinase|nr:polyphosphate kinase 1 [Tannerella sp.]
MENGLTAYEYFKRDVSWLSFNYRVLLEAEDAGLPLYERIHFLSIYSSNLEEFYEIRVAEHRGVLLKTRNVDESAEEARETLEQITAEVHRQEQDFYRIFNEEIRPELSRQGIYLYPDSKPQPFHETFVRNYFNEEVFPFLTPVLLQPGELRTFIRDRRLYLVARMRKRLRPGSEELTGPFQYALLKIPYTKTPRFVELPAHGGKAYIMFVDDIIRANLPFVFPGYVVESCFSIKISRDADIFFDEQKGGAGIVDDIRRKLKLRKLGDLSRFMYDREMPPDFLDFLCKAFHVHADALAEGGRYLNLQDLAQFPNPIGPSLERIPPEPLPVAQLENAYTVSGALKNSDCLLHFPYQRFDYLLRLLQEAGEDPSVEEIKITQYRVAEHSAVINRLIAAARAGKRVTVFVELKARFDEENNMSAAERMKEAGVRIIYSLPGLKVHAKVALILRKEGLPGITCICTGNFNEKTAAVYSDLVLMTEKSELVADVASLFDFLEDRTRTPHFSQLLVARFNMTDALKRMIHREIEHAAQGRKAYILLKMNGLHDKDMIDELYRASEAGVQIDLIVRGICCLAPGRPYSRNIHLTRIVDMFLEHARVWYFYNDGAEDLFLSSADWMRRNLSRRIEAAAPILDPRIKAEVLHLLQLQLRDNVKACFIDGNLVNHFKHDERPPLRAQQATYEFLKDFQK